VCYMILPSYLPPTHHMNLTDSHIHDPFTCPPPLKVYTSLNVRCRTNLRWCQLCLRRTKNFFRMDVSQTYSLPLSKPHVFMHASHGTTIKCIYWSPFCLEAIPIHHLTLMLPVLVLVYSPHLPTILFDVFFFLSQEKSHSRLINQLGLLRAIYTNSLYPHWVLQCLQQCLTVASIFVAGISVAL
jgi:hypothetical protein